MNNQALIRLFKAIHIKDKKKQFSNSRYLLNETLPRGFVFSPIAAGQLMTSWSKERIDNTIKEISQNIGISPEELNASFHKSWTKVATADIRQLIIEQICHYFTTYGAEYLGIYNEEFIYIPHEKLKLPKLIKEDLKLVVIKGLTKKEIKEKILQLLNSGIALSEQTINDIIDISRDIDIRESDLELIKNKEIKADLYNHLDLLPENPVEFLRYVIYQTTGRTLLIKNQSLINDLKAIPNNRYLELFLSYKNKYGFHRLAEIFYRFKPIFLAFKDNYKATEMNTHINKIRKMAQRYHKPMTEDYLNSVTSMIKQGKGLNVGTVEKTLETVNIFRKIRLAYALKYRTKKSDSILYRIRNGKSYATEFSFEDRSIAESLLISSVLPAIIDDLSPNVKDKKIYIPQYINYALPATEKQFTGNFPSGTYISIPNDMILGINWRNVKYDINRSYRIDLDLSLLTPGKKYGWDANYRSDRRDMLFSGDMTDASGPHGSTELFYVKKQLKSAFLLMLNYFNYTDTIEVPFKIIVAKEKAKDFRSNYMVNPNNVLVTTLSKISCKQKILGLLLSTTKESKFYFAETAIGKSITSGNKDYTRHANQYLLDFYSNSISFNDLLVKAGAILADSKDDADIDLSPENIDKTTIINLILGA